MSRCSMKSNNKRPLRNCRNLTELVRCEAAPIGQQSFGETCCSESTAIHWGIWMTGGLSAWPVTAWFQYRYERKTRYDTMDEASPAAIPLISGQRGHHPAKMPPPT